MKWSVVDFFQKSISTLKNVFFLIKNDEKKIRQMKVWDDICFFLFARRISNESEWAIKSDGKWLCGARTPG